MSTIIRSSSFVYKRYREDGDDITYSRRPSHPHDRLIDRFRKPIELEFNRIDRFRKPIELEFNNVYHNSGKNWIGVFELKKKIHYCGVAQNALECARKVNIVRKSMGLQPINLKAIEIAESTDNYVVKKNARGRCKFRCVSPVNTSNKIKWYGVFRYRLKAYYCGMYNSALDAAKAVNKKRIELRLEPINKKLIAECEKDETTDVLFEELPNIEEQTSVYKYVYRSNSIGKVHYAGKFKHNKKTYLFKARDNELDVALEINKKLIELGKDPVNTVLITAMQSLKKCYQTSTSTTSTSTTSTSATSATSTTSTF